MRLIRSTMVAFIISLLALPSFAQETLTSEDLFLRAEFTADRIGPVLGRLGPDRRGEDLDLSERRPVVDLTDNAVFQEKYGKPGYRTLANFYHRGQFHIVRVPENGVKEVYFQFWYFPPFVPFTKKYMAAHSLLRFEMHESSPIEVVAQMPGEELIDQLQGQSAANYQEALPQPYETPELLKNVAISAEAQWTKQVPKKEYNLFRGAMGQFTQIVRFVSMEERLKMAVGNSGQPVDQVAMATGTEVGSRALFESLRVSESDGTSKIYHTLLYNCTTLAFDVLDTVGGYVDSRFGFVRSYAQRRYPVLSGGKLMNYGGIFVQPAADDPSLAEEREKAAQNRNPTQSNNIGQCKSALAG